LPHPKLFVWFRLKSGVPKLQKTAGNLVSTRLAIPDEYVAACGWDSDEFVDIERYRDPQEDGAYCLIIRRLTFKDDQLTDMHAQSRARADAKKREREAAASKDKSSK